MLKYYICDYCRFQFERIGKCEQCPDCGKEYHDKVCRIINQNFR